MGRPRTRWADVVKRDALQLLGVRGWRRRAENRDEWRHALWEAKAPEGAVVPYMEWNGIIVTLLIRCPFRSNIEIQAKIYIVLHLSLFIFKA